MKLSILSRFDASLLFECEAEENSLEITLRTAMKSGANLYGADLRGADLRGADLDGEKLSKTPIQINNLKWFVLISDTFMRIGCQRYTIEEWRNFSDEEIVKMDFGALKFWRQWKVSLLAMCDAHNKREEDSENKEMSNANEPT